MAQTHLDWPTRGELYDTMRQWGDPRFILVPTDTVGRELQQKADACKLTPGFAMAVRAEAANNGGQRNYCIDRI